MKFSITKPTINAITKYIRACRPNTKPGLVKYALILQKKSGNALLHNILAQIHETASTKPIHAYSGMQSRFNLIGRRTEKQAQKALPLHTIITFSYI